MSDHIPSDVLSSLASNASSPERLQEMMRHLLRCRKCFLSLAQSAERKWAPPPEAEKVYDEVIGRVFSETLQRAQELRIERARTQKLLSKLEAGGVDALPAIKDPGWQVPLVRALMQRSWDLRHEGSREMEDLAVYAEIVSRRIDASDLEAPRLADLRCEVWISLANAHRVRERLGEAEEAFGIALSHLVCGTGYEILRARLLDLQSSLHRAYRRLDAAREYLKLAYGIYSRYGECQLAGAALINWGIVEGQAGRYPESFKLLERGLKRVSESNAPDLEFSAVHNQIWFLVDCGLIEEARRKLFANRFRYDRDKGRLTPIRLRWVEARIDAALGKLDRASEGFHAVKQALEGLNLRYDVALAALDLAAVAMRQKRLGEARELTLGAAQAFIDLRIQREAMAAALFLRETFRQGLATLARLEEVTAFLRRAQHDPSVVYMPAAAS